MPINFVFPAGMIASPNERGRNRILIRTFKTISMVIFSSAIDAKKIFYPGGGLRNGKLHRKVLGENSHADYGLSIMKIPMKQPEWRIYNPGGKLAFCSINHSRKKFAHSFSTYSHLKNSPRFRRDHHLSRLPNSIHIEKAHLPRLWKSFGNRIKSSFYASTSDVASSTSLPNWWPLSNLDDKHITFADHVAHVVVPHTTDKQITKDCNSRDVSTIDEKDLGLNCENIVQWVLYHAQNETSQSISQSNGFDHFIDACESVDSSSTSQRARICDEWNYCERMSEISIHRTDISERRGEDSRQYNILDPAFRHDPSLLPQRSNIDDNGRHLNAAELFALGSVWYLPYSSSTTIVDRFDPSSGVKPQRLNVGDMNRTVSWGDYFRIHFNPRRFTETNRFDWGSKFEDGHAGRSGQRFNKKGHDVQAKPGIVVARDDDVGYLVINKPPNVPVHPTVDNLLENVASSIGRCLWNERKDEILSGEYALNHTTIKQREDVHPSSNNTIQYTQNSKIKKRRQKKEPLVYVATPQRLDQNTSGLLVVASKKSFAAYFAKLLRTKTSGQLISGGAGRNSTTNIEDINLTLASKSKSPCGVHKSYRCLVCIMPKTKFSEDAETIHTGSMMMEVERLRKYQTQGTVIRHFLEPSIRAPKRFLTTIPVGVDDAKSWAECLLKITKVGDVCTVVGNAPSDSLARELWGMHGKPNETCAVAELEIELLTGRTHQIRGQLAAMNFPLVGDVQYGGAVPSSSTLWQKNYGNKQNPDREIQSYIDSEKLALQCCSLEFLDPKYSEDEPETNAKRSNRWNSFRLDNAFWTSFLQNYHDESAKLSSSEITSILDEEMTFRDSSHDIQPSSVGAELNVKLPPRVLLSHGTNKYIIVKAWRPDRETMMGLDSDVDDPNVLWFVRSASPSECGGPYHANVAEGILRELAALGFMTKVTGGGRIDYCVSKEMSHAHVFGFSYGFGKGNHELVASIIEDFTDVIATYDNSDNLY